MSMVPVSVIASGWIPFLIILGLAMVFSIAYVIWYRSTVALERSRVVTTLSIFSLTVIMVTSTLVPVDVFLVSNMKNANGTYQAWAESKQARDDVEGAVLDGYYTFYSIILALAFFLLPLAFFYHACSQGHTDGEQDLIQEETTKTRCIRALQYTSVCVVIFGILITIGALVPMGSSWTLLKGSELAVFHEAQKAHQNESLLVFLMNVLNTVGIILLVIYTGYGMSTFPLGLIKGQRSVHTDRSDMMTEINDLEEQVQALKEDYEGRAEAWTSIDQERLERLEQRLRLLRRSEQELNNRSRSCLNRIVLCCRPFQVVFGFVFASFGGLIFISLLLISIDKAINGTGPETGFILMNSTLPQPMDTLLVYAQVIFPLDYIIYALMIMYFIFCTMSGVKHIGIRLLWLPLYKIRPGKTRPQALVMMCVTLMFIMLALNVVLFSVVPDYTAFGSQHFVHNVTVNNVTTSIVKKCEFANAPADQCNMTRIAYLLLAFHSKTWFFGAIFYYSIWIFVIVIIIGFGTSLYQMRRHQLVELDEDREELFDTSNPFASA